MDIENESKDKKGKNNLPWWQPSMIFFGRISGWVVGPIIIAVFIGSWLDKKYSSGPWLFLLSTAVAFIISIFGLVKETLGYIKKIESENKKKDNDRTNNNQTIK